MLQSSLANDRSVFNDKYKPVCCSQAHSNHLKFSHIVIKFHCFLHWPKLLPHANLLRNLSFYVWEIDLDAVILENHV